MARFCTLQCKTTALREASKCCNDHDNHHQCVVKLGAAAPCVVNGETTRDERDHEQQQEDAKKRGLLRVIGVVLFRHQSYLNAGRGGER